MGIGRGKMLRLFEQGQGKVSAYNFVAGSMDLELKHHNYTELQED